MDTKCLVDDFIGDCRIEKSITFFVSCLNTIFVNSIENSLIMVLLTFLKKNMLNPQITLVVYLSHILLVTLDVNFSHKNGIFQIWVQLMKWSLLGAISTPIENFEKFINSNIV